MPYNPNQPREPAGTAIGGRWTSTGAALQAHGWEFAGGGGGETEYTHPGRPGHAIRVREGDYWQHEDIDYHWGAGTGRGAQSLGEYLHGLPPARATEVAVGPKAEDYTSPGTHIDASARAVLEAPDVETFRTVINADPNVQASRRLLETGTQSKAYHVDAHGNYTPERQALHDQIVDDIMAQGQPVPAGTQPRLVMFMGQPGSGKTSVLGHLVAGSSFTTLNIDDVRTRLQPEYNPKAAGLTQDEAGDIEIQTLDRLNQEAPRNIILDWTGKTASKVLDVAQHFQGQGYAVEMYEVHTNDLESAKRAYARFRYGREGRYVDSDYILGVDQKPTASYNVAKASGYVDRWASYDNNVGRGQRARLVDQGHR